MAVCTWFPLASRVGCSTISSVCNGSAAGSGFCHTGRCGSRRRRSGDDFKDTPRPNDVKYLRGDGHRVPTHSFIVPCRGCAGLSASPARQRQADVELFRTWPYGHRTETTTRAAGGFQTAPLLAPVALRSRSASGEARPRLTPTVFGSPLLTGYRRAHALRTSDAMEVALVMPSQLGRTIRSSAFLTRPPA